MKKIVIIGPGGSGKSTLAKNLGLVLGLPIIHLDIIHWKPGWIHPPKDEWLEIVQEIVNEESWIIEGDYYGTMDIRFNAADTIIFLDMPRFICIWRIINRWITYFGRTRPEMAQGCPEKVNLLFIKWIWNYSKYTRPKVLRKLDNQAHDNKKQIIQLSSSTEVSDFLSELNG